jgi:hypothetical protein
MLYFIYKYISSTYLYRIILYLQAKRAGITKISLLEQFQNTTLLEQFKNTTVRTVPKYHTVRTVQKYHTVRTVQ